MSLYYQDEYVTLYHDDCLENQNWKFADVLVTDPPYGIDRHRNSMHYNKSIKTAKSVVANDEDAKIRDLVLGIWGAKPAIVFGSWRIDRPAKTKQRLIWHKTKVNPGMTTAPWFAAEEEIYILGSGFSGKPSQNVYATHEARGGSDGLAAVTGHPTPKPVPLMEMLIEKCPPGVIADPFAGSGATLIAAKNQRRKVVGLELEERYCEIIAKRCAQDVLDIFGGAA
jgi:DNA modification methylase